MRSHLIYGALSPVKNRYMLCQLVSKATRKFHRPQTRVQDTMNQIFDEFSKANTTEKVMAMPAVSTSARRKAA